MTNDDRSTIDILLDHMSVTLEAAAICHIAKGSSLLIPAQPRSLLFYILEGGGNFSCSGRSVGVKAHDLVLVPSGIEHRVGDLDGTPPIAATGPSFAQLEDGVHQIKIGSGDCALLAVCAELTLASPGMLVLLSTLQEPAVWDLLQVQGLHEMYLALSSEVTDPGPGTRVLIETLLKQSLIHALRRDLAEEGAIGEWVSGLRDPRLANTLARIIGDLRAQHTVDSLASEAGLSRSAFSAHFKAAFGFTPMALLRELRLRQAAALLQSSGASVKQVAREVGYDSRSHFSRAFTARFGVAPSDWPEA